MLNVEITGPRAEGKSTLATVICDLLQHVGFNVTKREADLPRASQALAERIRVEMSKLDVRDVEIVVRNDGEHLDFDSYMKLARITQAPGFSDDQMTVNAALGLAGEGGEVADLVKKWQFHGHGLPDEKIQKELGDILWYVAQACWSRGYSMREIAEQNIDKLRQRYPEGFSRERSINRHEDRPHIARGEDFFMGMPAVGE